MTREAEDDKYSAPKHEANLVDDDDLESRTGIAFEPDIARLPSSGSETIPGAGLE
jgi:hypothetical protein